MHKVAFAMINLSAIMDSITKFAQNEIDKQEQAQKQKNRDFVNLLREAQENGYGNSIADFIDYIDDTGQVVPF